MDLGTPGLGGFLPPNVVNPGSTRFLAPVLLTTSQALPPPPPNAVAAYVFLAGAGGSGANGSGTTYLSGGGEGAFGAFRLDLVKLGQIYRQFVAGSLTIGVGGLSRSRVGTTGTQAVSGLTGGNSSITIAGVTIWALGGDGGPGNTSALVSSNGGSMSFNSSNTSDIPFDFIFGNGLPMLAALATSTTRYGQGSASSAAPFTHACGDQRLNTGVVLPWWVLQAGLSLSTVLPSGSGAGATGGAPGFNGKGGNVDSGPDASAAAAASGFAAGGGPVAGAVSNGTTFLSGPGAPGVSVLMYEVKA